VVLALLLSNIWTPVIFPQLYWMESIVISSNLLPLLGVTIGNNLQKEMPLGCCFSGLTSGEG
jgi:hypothetical protein